MDNIIVLQQNAMINAQVYMAQANSLIASGRVAEAQKYSEAATAAFTQAQNYAGMIAQYYGTGADGYATDFGRIRKRAKKPIRKR